VVAVLSTATAAQPFSRAEAFVTGAEAEAYAAESAAVPAMRCAAASCVLMLPRSLRPAGQRHACCREWVVAKVGEKDGFRPLPARSAGRG
jgi:hypothetical protein